MDIITFALPKGRLLDESGELLSEAGLGTPVTDDSCRVVETGNLRWLVVRPWDVPVYVERGVADLGIVGSDVLAERGCDVAELVDLNIGYCRFVLARPADADLPVPVRVATKFPRVAARYCREQGMEAEIIELRGATELAPAVGLADVVVDLTATGRTLMVNGLEVVAVIGESTGRLIANPVSLRLKGLAMQDLIKRLQTAAGRTAGIACG